MHMTSHGWHIECGWNWQLTHFLSRIQWRSEVEGLVRPVAQDKLAVLTAVIVLGFLCILSQSISKLGLNGLSLWGLTGQIFKPLITACSLHFSLSCFTRLKLDDLMSASAETGKETVKSTSEKANEKRILIRGSIPTIHCANKSPEIVEGSDRDRRRSQAVSVKSSNTVFAIYTTSRYCLY